MYELSVKASFSAAHRVVGHQGGCDKLHGHNWDVELLLSGNDLDDMGFLVDFKEVKKALRELLDPLDHADLNKVQPFNTVNPTSENLAAYLFREAARRLNGSRCRVSGVRVAESPGTSCLYREG
jgi:6-pyruvoyltetrahydropterin/6-carboxytetrahydropterin synthase